MSGDPVRDTTMPSAPRGRRLPGRLSVRLRVALALAGVMAVVLTATGLFVYLQLATQLDATIDRGLRARAGDVGALVQSRAGSLTTSGRSALTEQGENLAQVLDRSGAIVDATPTLRGTSLLGPGDLARAVRGTIVFDGRTVDEHDPARVLATPVVARGSRFVVVIGAPLEDRDDALSRLAGLLLLGGPAALLLASLAGYAATRAALRPVERLRLQAESFRLGRRGTRLPVPASDDEIGRLGQTLNAMLARLEEAFDRERTFVSDASHELRTPLAILRAELELALSGGHSVAELEAAVASAAEETDRLIQIAEDLLVIARTDQGQLRIRRGRVGVLELLEDVERRFSRRTREAEATLVSGGEPGLAFVGDRLRVEQAVGNLVDNALRHGATRVELEAAAQDGFVVLRVTDDGPGFPPGFLDVAFERFTRADGARGRGGSGLGLAIVRAIVQAHEGTVTASNRSAPKTGAVLELRLPGEVRPAGRPINAEEPGR